MTGNRKGRSLRWLAIAIGSFSFSFASGCGAAPQGSADLVPPDLEASKIVLAASLDAWKADRRSSGVLSGSKPTIGVVDSARTERPLIDYKVIGPLMTLGKARPFAVRLVLGEPCETVMTRYLVIGRDPLWVFRQDDFERMLHWEHKMDGDPAPSLAEPSNSAR